MEFFCASAVEASHLWPLVPSGVSHSYNLLLAYQVIVIVLWKAGQVLKHNKLSPERNEHGRGSRVVAGFRWARTHKSVKDAGRGSLLDREGRQEDQVCEIQTISVIQASKIQVRIIQLKCRKVIILWMLDFQCTSQTGTKKRN